MTLDRYAADQNAFFKQYSISFERMTNMTTSSLFPTREIIVDVHKHLFEEGTLQTTTTSSSSPTSSIAPNISPSVQSSAKTMNDVSAQGLRWGLVSLGMTLLVCLLFGA